MSNAVYPEYLAALGRAELNVTTVDWWMLPLDPDASFDPTNTVLGDVIVDAVGSGLQLTFDGQVVLPGPPPLPMGVRYTTSGLYVFTDITSADQVGALAVYADDGVDTWLAAWLDTKSDTSALSIVGTGSGVQVSFPGGWFIQL
jgi:hypothetical protein